MPKIYWFIRIPHIDFIPQPINFDVIKIMAFRYKPMGFTHNCTQHSEGNHPYKNFLPKDNDTGFIFQGFFEGFIGFCGSVYGHSKSQSIELNGVKLFFHSAFLLKLNPTFPTENMNFLGGSDDDSTTGANILTGT